LQRTFEAAITEKEAAFEEALNVKNEVLHLKNALCQAQTQAWQDALMI
jgi:hypothetical protein